MVIATGQNNLAMNRAVKQIAQHYVKGPQDPRGDSQPPGGGHPRIRPLLELFDPCRWDDAASCPPRRLERDGARRSLEKLTPMSDPRPGTVGTMLVIGYGNSLRSDDGAGPTVAAAVALWDIPGVVSVAVHQLTPELAELLPHAELAIFVDARLANGGECVEARPLETPEETGLYGHVCDPSSLLALGGRNPWTNSSMLAGHGPGDRFFPGRGSFENRAWRREASTRTDCDPCRSGEPCTGRSDAVLVNCRHRLEPTATLILVSNLAKP